jgi:hypothetical protein
MWLVSSAFTIAFSSFPLRFYPLLRNFDGTIDIVDYFVSRDTPMIHYPHRSPRTTRLPEKELGQSVPGANMEMAETAQLLQQSPTSPLRGA